MTTDDIITKFRELEGAGRARLLCKFDEDPDVSWMDDDEREAWGGEAYGSIVEVRCHCCGKWGELDSRWGHIGYKDVLCPLENPYVLDHMLQAVQHFENQ
jgi:hypothetical protein